MSARKKLPKGWLAAELRDCDENAKAWDAEAERSPNGPLGRRAREMAADRRARAAKLRQHYGIKDGHYD